MQYILMNKKTPILSCIIDESTNVIIEIDEVFSPEYLPVSVQITKKGIDRRTLNDWWRGRAIPASRQGLDEALQELELESADYLVTKGYGLSLSDQYWVNPDGRMNWEEVNFFDHDFSEDIGNILFGKSSGEKELDFISPDNTSDGWLRKKWKIINDERCLVKGGSTPYLQEPLNEVFAATVLKWLGYQNYIGYELLMEGDEPYSVCKNFITPDTELVTAWHIYSSVKKENHISPYDHFISCCDHLGIKGMREYLDFMMTFDYLIVNIDRHMNNFGAIRDVNTLEFIGPTPIFDNGTSLWYNKLDRDIQADRDVKSKPFRSSHAKQIKIVSSFEAFDAGRLSGIGEEFSGILKHSDYIEETRRDALCLGVERRLQSLRRIIHGY